MEGAHRSVKSIGSSAEICLKGQERRLQIRVSDREKKRAEVLRNNRNRTAPKESLSAVLDPAFGLHQRLAMFTPATHRSEALNSTSTVDGVHLHELVLQDLASLLLAVTSKADDAEVEVLVERILSPGEANFLEVVIGFVARAWSLNRPLDIAAAVRCVGAVHDAATPLTCLRISEAAFDIVVCAGVQAFSSISDIRQNSVATNEENISATTTALHGFDSVARAATEVLLRLVGTSRCSDHCFTNPTFSEFFGLLCRLQEDRAALMVSVLFHHTDKLWISGLIASTVTHFVRSPNCCIEARYYGLVSLRLAIDKHWDSVTAVIGDIDVCLMILREKDDLNTIELLKIMKEMRQFLETHSELIVPLLQQTFRESTEKKEAVLDVFSAAPKLVVADEAFLTHDILPVVRDSWHRGYARKQVLDVLVQMCCEGHLDVVRRLVKQEHLDDGFDVDKLTDGEAERLEALLEHLDMGSGTFWQSSVDETSPREDFEFAF